MCKKYIRGMKNLLNLFFCLLLCYLSFGCGIATISKITKDRLIETDAETIQKQRQEVATVIKKFAVNNNWLLSREHKGIKEDYIELLRWIDRDNEEAEYLKISIGTYPVKGANYANGIKISPDARTSGGDLWLMTVGPGSGVDPGKDADALKEELLKLFNER